MTMTMTMTGLRLWLRLQLCLKYRVDWSLMIGGREDIVDVSYPIKTWSTLEYVDIKEGILPFARICPLT